MRSLYKKSQLAFSIAFIIIYCVGLSLADSMSESVGIQKVATFPLALLLSLLLYFFFKQNSLLEECGLCKSEVGAKKMLYYIPVLLMLTVNLWHGTALNLSVLETVLYILTMLCVGFLEEVIFRGLLFNAMVKDNVRSAVIISSVTFGIGHIINLFNGSQAELLPNILQVIYAMAAGFMFVMIYYKTESLILCIVTHGLFNALSVFANEDTVTLKQRIVSCVLLVLISGGYALYISLAVKRDKKNL